MRKLFFYLITVLFFVSANKGLSQDCETREAESFNSIFAMGKMRIEIIPFQKDSLVLFAENALTDDIITEISEGELDIRLKTGIPSNAKIKVELYYKDLKKISVASNALLVSADTLKTSSMIFEARSGAKMELKLSLNSLVADIKQGASLVFYGEVKKQEVSVSSGGAYSAFELRAGETVIKASTNGRAKVRSTEAIEATANTTGYISYKGSPAKEKIKTSFGGEVVELEE